MHKPNEVPAWTSTFLNSFLPSAMYVNRRRVGFALGQELYTPAKIMRVGGAVRYRGFETVVSVVHRTREFDLQIADEKFVSITFQFHF